MQREIGPDNAGREARGGSVPDQPWRKTLQDALVAGSVVSVFTIATAALRGRADNGSAVAPINAASHVIYGAEASEVDGPDLKHTVLGVGINVGACVFWAALYERLFGRSNNRGIGLSLLGGGLVAAMAYLVDYHLVPKRLTPGWEEHVSDRSLAIIFGAMALSLPMRSLFERYPSSDLKSEPSRFEVH